MKALKMKELRQKVEKIGREGGLDIDTQGKLRLIVILKQKGDDSCI